MARELTLLERLRSGEEPTPGHTAVENTNLLMRSVRDNISRILNAREAHALAQPDYGTPPPSEIVYGFPSSVGRMQRCIKTLLEKFEPRLGDIQVIHVENEHKHMLVLRYQLVVHDGPVPAKLVNKLAEGYARK